MNTVCLAGRLVRDPMHTAPTGTDRTWFVVAGDRPSATDATDFIPVTCFNGVAKAAAQYLQQGSKVAVTGQVRSRRYDQDGETIHSIEVTARTVDFIGDRPAGTEPAGASDEEPF